MKRPPIDVSDHAVVRYLERARGIDLDRLRLRIARLAASAVKHEAQSVTIDGVRFVVSEGVVCTVTETRAHRERRLKRRRRTKP